MGPHLPLKPRPKLLLVTGIAMAAWILALIVMYFTTIYPGSHQPPVSRPAAQR
jgi:hypothetical protein